MVIFNVLYLAAKPFQYGGLPSLYNIVFPGRLRMYWTDKDSYMVNETKMPRLLADLTVARPKTEDEYRVIVLGSSETWGYFNRPQDTWPVVLDSIGLKSPDGKQVRFYNLSYPIADGLKDLI